MIPILWALMIPSCVAIAYIDYLLMKDWFKCERCGYERVKWYNWLLPTVLEILLFLAGIGIGAMMMK